MSRGAILLGFDPRVERRMIELKTLELEIEKHAGRKSSRTMKHFYHSKTLEESVTEWRESICFLDNPIEIQLDMFEE